MVQTQKKARSRHTEQSASMTPQEWQSIVANPDYIAGDTVSGEYHHILSRSHEYGAVCGTASTISCGQFELQYDLNELASDGICGGCLRIALARVRKQPKGDVQS